MRALSASLDYGRLSTAASQRPYPALSMVCVRSFLSLCVGLAHGLFMCRCMDKQYEALDSEK